MKLTLSLAAAALATTFAAQAFAAAHEMDPMSMTCADFSAMDSEGMMAATDSVDMAMMTADMTEDEKMAAMEEHDAMMADDMSDEDKAAMEMKSEESMTMIMDACGGDGMADMTVMDAMKASK